MTTTHLLYLHGFRSSPHSHKAQAMAAYMAQHHPQVHWWCPQLPPSPKAAMQLLLNGIADWPRDSMAVVGSSLGGFYATRIAEATECRAMLINPAVDPARDLGKYIGENRQWHAPEESFFFLPEYVDELRTLQVGELQHPQRYRALLAKGDEVLDWREMHARYGHTQVTLLEGGDHALTGFEEYLPDFARFMGLPPNK
ncbi:YqiA/YcfP family alpha/beta fold hydrolase [Rhodoferax mekongensis]|uniref:YqiA/YcfP family alpha/beta fold hydrolase n=1 Tax=Rhodoferax mekongensis TaxID=3068341 RepID=UPI0028BE81F9|nr:YqiA/YcfP family alpha/beta fold hydrolase [Rhodoferax sp. TBRC 17199]MDT7516706.1 YqiA/YcfP family alpha/beta fold hydrolase [Rhodoferax sp. TBRC 17199]